MRTDIPAFGSIATLVQRQAQARPGAPALLAPGRRALSYAELHAQVMRLGDHLHAMGATPATRVAVLLPNGPEMAAAFLGLAANAACAPLNPAHRAEELRFHLQDTRADMLLMQRGAPGPAREVALELGLKLIEIEVDDAGPAGRFRLVGELPAPAADRVACAPDDVALLLHTSGTTARPKLVPLSQANLMASAHHIAAHLGLSARDRCLNVMPLFHIHGLVGALLATLAGGGSIVCTPGFDDQAYFDWIARFDPSWTTAVPTIHQAVLAHGAAYRQKAPTHRFRFVRSSSAALPAATLRALQALLKAPVVEAYGMTEASHQMASNPVQAGEQTAGCVGVAAGAQIVILDVMRGAEGRPLGAGQAGEVAIRGPGVMGGYENNLQANAEAFHDGWFRTGDLGHLDAQGRLFISGRLKEIVNRGGEKVSPREVDDALLEHPGVVQAAAFGVPHPSLGEDLAAAVVRRAGSTVDEAALREFLFARLADFKVPSQIVFVHALPTGATGKVQRGELLRVLGASLTRAFVALGTDAERAVAAIFADLLASGPLGLHDNFFAKGGDSLKGARVIARVNGRFGVDLPVTTLFRHPSVAELVAQIESAGVARPDGVFAQALVPRPPGELAPCSFSQEALWIVERLVGGAGVYNNAQAVRIGGPLDVAALDQALQALVARHESLRTSIEEHDGVPVQRVHSNATVRLVQVDAGELGTPGQEAALQQRLADQAGQIFDLATAPLLRASLWRLAPHDHVLLLVVHHVVTDGWSTQVIAHDLGLLYTAFSEGRAPVLPPLAIQFADWSLWQRQRLQGERLAADLRYWRGQLAGLLPLALPTDLPRPAQPSYAGRDHPFSVPPALLAPLRALAREHDVTLFMLLLAAFKVLLMRYSQQDDVAVGSPVAGRERPELEGLVGCFVNSVVLRTDLSGNPTFSELLARVRQTALDAYGHQELPFDQLVAELSRRTEAPVQRDLSRNPLVQLSFALNNQPAPVYGLKGVEARPWPLTAAFAKFDLSLSFVEAGDELQAVFEYSTDLFEASTVHRLRSHLLNLLAGIAADPGRRVAQLPLLGDAERRQMLVDWNHTGTPKPAADAIHTLVERQARRTPDGVALVFGDQRLSYGRLDAQANQLAHWLRRRGVAAEVPVAVCTERSLPMVVAMLAVLKAGGALVPLDPALPPQRLALMLQDTKAPVLLTQASLASRVPASADGDLLRLLCLDTQWHEVAEASESVPPDGTTAATQLAYVIYTSGSTGQPKGVMLEHRAWANHVQWMQCTLNLTPADRFLQITSIGFDAAMVELFMPLQAGATLVLAAPGEHRDLAYVARVVREQAITVIQMVPSALRSLLAEPRFDGRSLRHVICGGEAMDRALVTELRRRLPQATLGNFYGPTETAIDATHFEVPRSFDGEGGVPIGRPIANTRCHVLDRHLQPVPVGVTGELFVGGTGLARGYLNQPRLTAERFVADPFAAGERLYRTGDLARYRADGQIDCLGRSDAQVKIRGHRIELGEVEAALRALPGVLDGVVLAREDVPGLKRLVAYVAGNGIATAQLKAALAQQLPDPMVPTAFVLLTQWPRLPNGKVDRLALPAPEQPADHANATAIAPRTATEQALRQIWRDVLHTEPIGVHDHFFELGGHSLLATQVVARLRVALHVELPLRAMFEHPTLEALAAEIDRTLAARHHGANGDGSPNAAGAPAPIPKVGRDGPLAVSYSQRRMWLVQTLNPRTTAYNMSFGLRLLGPLNGDALARAIDVVVQRHEAFRTRFGALNGEVVHWVDPPRPAPVERIDLRRLAPEQREHEALAQRDKLAGRRFELSASGLYRISLLQMAEKEHVLLWVIHHVIGDHWSDGILLREMGQAYAALLQGRPPALPPLQIEYADYATWQRADAQSALLTPHMAYWTRRLQGIRPLPLPHDLAWRELPSGRGASVSAHLPASTLAGLQGVCSQHGVTPFMAMLACFKLVLSRYSGQTDIAVGSPVANRTRVEAESLVGTLVNTLVLRTDLSGDPSWAELLARVRETALEAFEHQDAPFERLVEELHVDRSSRRQPLVQVLFNVINAPFDVNAMPGLSLQPFAYASTAAQFELGLNVDDAFGELRLTYSTDLFVRSTAERLLASFLKVMDQMLADPRLPVHDVDVIGESEYAELQRWNATPVAFDPAMRLGDLIRRQVLRSGDATAVVFEERRLSYRELDAAARTLALRLRALGAGPGVLVGVCLERCPELVSALLGVVYSGAAYVPLDPTYPPERLARMAEDASMTLVLSRPAEWQRLGPALPASLRMIDIDSPIDNPDDNRQDSASFELTGTAQDPAYVIFTSGSTGRPKGAMNAHAGVVNWLQWMQSEYGLSPQDRVLLKTPYSFDVSLREFFWPLMTGASIVVARPDGHRDSAYLVELIRRERITLLHFVPSMLRIFLDEPGLEQQCASVQRVVCSGEALPADAVALFFQRLPHSRLCNLYGPTEAAVEVTYWECRPGDGEGGAPSVPIGRPVANTRMHVLDGRLRPQPVGVAGELYIGGVQVGMGYVGRPELTAERFIADPLHPGGRLYRTGDLARWRSDGVLDYLGRADDQVKIRGHRIELGEIEACLGTHPEVARCVVIVREDSPGDKRLVAYVVAAHDVAPDAAALRDHLRASLPEFMLPQHVVPVPSLPLLSNGKLDRRALPAPDLVALMPDRRSEQDVPQTDAERLVAEVWQALLGVPHIGRSDNFFDLGGHSLLAMRAVNELEQRRGVKLDLRRLVFESLAQIAAVIDGSAARGGEPVPRRSGLFGRLLDGIGLGRPGGPA